MNSWMKRHALKDNRGFTLVEILVAVVIAGLILGAIGTVMVQGLKVLGSGNKALDLETEAQRTLNLVTNKLMEAQSLSIDKNKNTYTIKTSQEDYEIVLEDNRLMVNGDEICDYVDTENVGFSIAAKDMDGDKKEAPAAVVTLNLVKGGQNFNQDMTVNFRIGWIPVDIKS